MADERDELDEVFDGLEMAWVDVAKARSIRARERNLAELAREAREYYLLLVVETKRWGLSEPEYAVNWLRRYEEALK